MPEPRTVLEHLLDSRDALLREVASLITAISELDSVIGRIGGAELRSRLAAAPIPAPAAAPALGTATVTTSAPIGAAEDGSVPATNAAAAGPTGKPAAPGRRTGASSGAASRSRTTAAGARTGRRPSAAAQVDGQKSIRVHVLEMLAAEQRDFGLAEIIDRIHDFGIAAHDDAVRSITIKLMKDGKVERVGRGQYRLARRSSPSRNGARPAATDAASPVNAPSAGEPAGAVGSGDPAPLVAQTHALDEAAGAERDTAPEITPAASPAALPNPETELPQQQAPEADAAGYAPPPVDGRQGPVAEPMLTPQHADQSIDVHPARGFAFAEAESSFGEAESPFGEAEPSSVALASPIHPPPLNLAQPWDRAQ